MPILRRVMPRPTPSSAVAAVCALLVGGALVLAWQALALAADGSFYLVQVAGTESLFGPDSRVLANLVRQAPVLLAVVAGVTDTHLLAILLGVGQLVVPAIVWSLAVALSRSDRIVFGAVAMTAAVCAGATWYFSVSESTLAVPLTVLAGVLLWRPESWGWFSAGVAVVVGAVLVASYETGVLTGAVLAVWSGWRATQAAGRLELVGCASLAALSVASFVVALVGTRTGVNPTSSQSMLYFVVSLEPWQFYLLLAGIVSVVAALGWLGGPLKWAALTLGLCALALGIVALEPSPVTAFASRGGAAVAAFVLVVFLCWRWAKSSIDSDSGRQELSQRLLVAIPVAVVAAAVIANIIALRDWSRSLDAFRDQVNSTSGAVDPIEVLPPDRREVLWGWTSSSLSLLVRSRPDAGVLVDSNPSFVPFPPTEAHTQLGDEYRWGG